VIRKAISSMAISDNGSLRNWGGFDFTEIDQWLASLPGTTLEEVLDRCTAAAAGSTRGRSTMEVAYGNELRLGSGQVLIGPCEKPSTVLRTGHMANGYRPKTLGDSRRGQ
jgi:hypothetical protein